MAPEPDDRPGDDFDAELAELAALEDEDLDDDLADALADALDELDEEDDDVEMLDAVELRTLADKLDRLAALDLDEHGILLANVLVELDDGDALSVLVSFDEGAPAVLPHEIQRLVG